MRKTNCFLYLLAMFFLIRGMSLALPGTTNQNSDSSRRIVNIVNFIRQSEPRDTAITEDVLYETVQQEIALLKKYHLPGTFLLQYDALINPRYQQLLKTELDSTSEVGGWWEITQPHVEAAGLTWRGRYSWDWHANVGFATGYTTAEREKLVDVYMEKFKQIFGKYPTAIGSWFIDAHSLAYMYDKYHIVASCNCKDQIGTDGYTLWGGYWNQAYYPSRMNAYMPAQTISSQIGVPVFRMLGSDPIYQYESGLGGNIQAVETLEPVYERSGASRRWVDWFLKSMAEEPCLSFAYTQAGQENSFTWKQIKAGLEMQIPILDSLKQAGKISIKTLSASGNWFKNKFSVTPATAVTALSDYKEEGHKTVWYDSRYYRANIFWKKDSFYFRDIHLFDEKYASPYLNKAGTSTQCIYTTLPLVDGFLWSKINDVAGLRIMRIKEDGKAVEVLSKNPVVTEMDKNVLEVKWTDETKDTFKLLFFEDRFELECTMSNKHLKWFLELHAAAGVELPFKAITSQKISASLNNFEYSITCQQGRIEKGGQDNSYIFRIIPSNNKLSINCDNR